MLSKFFGTIRKFNNNVQIDLTLKREIEAFFAYKWTMDKNMAFKDEQDITIFEQLPEEVRQMIYQEFMFKEFLWTYRRTFTFPNKYNENQPSFYTWNHQVYRNFMIDMLRNLEPRREAANVVIYDELDEVNEVIFINQGTYEIGFEMNRIQTFVLRFKDSNVIGAYGVTFNKRTLFLYKTVTAC